MTTDRVIRGCVNVKLRFLFANEKMVRFMGKHIINLNTFTGEFAKFIQQICYNFSLNSVSQIPKFIRYAAIKYI